MIMAKYIKHEKVYEMLNDLGGCGAKPDTWADGWDKAIDTAIDNSEYRQQLIDTYGEDLVIQYEKKFDEWAKGKKAVNVNKYFEIDKWLLKDFG